VVVHHGLEVRPAELPVPDGGQGQPPQRVRDRGHRLGFRGPRGVVYGDDGDNREDHVDRKQARAFEGFVTESGDASLRMATLLTADPDAAEDVYQETLHRLAMRWSRVDSPRAFCRRVMHNIVIDQARARKRRPRELFAVHDRGDPRAGDPVTAAELRPALLAALGTLTLQQRTVVVLRYFDDLSENEVAELLGVSS
jgi:RNA polymerase sigma factor (sigma-70 family)